MKDEFEMLLGEIPIATPNHLNNPSSNHNQGLDLVSELAQRMTDPSYYPCDFTHVVDDDDSLKFNYGFASSPVTVNGFSWSDYSSSGGRSHSSSPPRNFISKTTVRDALQHYDQSPNWEFGRYAPPDSFTYVGGGLEAAPVPKKPVNFDMPPLSVSAWVGDHTAPNLLGSQYPTSPFVGPGPQLYRVNNTYPTNLMVPNALPLSADTPGLNNINPNPMFYSPCFNGGSGSSSNLAPLMQQYDRNFINYQQSVGNRRNKVGGGVDREESAIGCRTSRNARSRGHNTKAFHQENNNIGAWRSTQDRRLHHQQLNGNAARIQEPFQSGKIHSPFNRPWKINSLSEARGYMYQMAKDQQGCRFLQRVFAEGTSRDVQIIFNEIIGHAVELMMTPFGNYLMQKLLDVCSEDQKMHILYRVTEVPGELVRISLNTYGTRVVQKLVETLSTKQQISMVISALEPGFLALMKDLNGSHLIKRCLQCFPIEDKKFIFIAAAKYCVDIATHQNGCCALQSCIRHSTGEHREIFYALISANALLLAEDAYGNYVVQFILELENPYATSKLTSQFEGNYVNLSTQKFSSHVVEKCLWLCNEETRANIIHELLSASCFEQLLQDPYANYVIQTALRVSEGHVHYSLVDAIESYKAISRNSPYSKKIFSQKFSRR